MNYKQFFPIVLMLSCCGVLTPVKDSAIYHLLEPLAPNRMPTHQSPAMAVNRPSIPSYLDRQQLVNRAGGKLMISKLDLWGEPLDSAIANVTASNLSRITGSTNIQPVDNFVTPDYTLLLELRILRFEPNDSDQMLLEGTWKLQPTRGGEATSHYFKILMDISSSPSTSAARIIAMNKCLYHLARQVINEL